MTEHKKTTIVSIMWGSYLPAFIKAADESRCVDLTIFSQKEINNDSDVLDAFFKAAGTADAVLFYWTHDAFFEEIRARIDDVNKKAVIVTVSFDPTQWGLCATVSLQDCARAYGYMAEGGPENYKRLMEFTAHFLQPEIHIQDPVPMPWQGVMCPPDRQVYDTLEKYMTAHPFDRNMTVGLLFSRHTFTNGDACLEEALITAFQKRGLNVLPVFCNGTPDPDAGSLGPVKAAETYFFDKQGKPLIHALINLHYFFLGRDKNEDISETGVATQSRALFKKLNVPVFKPLVSYSKSIPEWEQDPQGLTAEVSFGIAMPEFEGNIEPVMVAASRKVTDEKTDTSFEIREVIPERVEYLADRVTNFIRLGRKRPEERKVVFVFHKNECAGLEADIGGAAGLDSGRSVVRIMNEMAQKGYGVKDIPETGEDLMQLFLERKAIAEFRWTTVDEIISKNGHLALLDNDIYQRWFDDLPQKAREEMIGGWGLPPGQKMNGVPPSMIYDNKLVITGLNFGNVNVIMQPKRGCAGSRCDGQVCRILHDPDIPPPHQYIATYMYMEKIFKADIIVHVGTHGNLEWLPGKGAGLSSACWPEIAIGKLPHLYIYNSDNPAEGVVAKRRSYAVTVNHLQAMLTISDTYEGLKDLDDLLNEYYQAQSLDPARAHQVEHLIQEAIDKNNLRKEVHDSFPKDFKAVTQRCHELISSVKNSQTSVGMHVFGDIPEKDDLAEYINTILRFDTQNEFNTRRLVFDLWKEDIFDALKNPGGQGKSGKPYSDLLFESDRTAKQIISRIVGKETLETILISEFGTLPDKDLFKRFQSFSGRVLDAASRINDSKEIDSLLNAMQGGHVPAGPSGFISRGRVDILPTGRNLYNVDPTRIPTKAACRVGIKLADALIERYKKE
ncbi:MAG: cobaltochelatase subunit CobN, partial [Proteobacteria bacterium]|nr:cobaltochelatase subunit CobN [Pseudomonadota bacterium]